MGWKNETAFVTDDILAKIKLTGVSGQGVSGQGVSGQGVMHPKSETRGSGKNWGHSAVIMEMTDEQTEAL
jgi:hypothetical protein